MQSYDRFIFHSYAFSRTKGEIQLHYGLDDHVRFTETLTLPRDFPYAPEIPTEALNQALCLLHLMGGISYYKTCVPKAIEVRSGALDDTQAAFWNTVYQHGLGEFFYRNQIDFRGLVEFPATKSPNANTDTQANRKLVTRNLVTRNVLVPIGGGKDSVVTLERLREAGFTVTLFRLGSHPILDEMAKIAGLPMITVERQLSPVLFDLNKQGALNGHVPITGYVSALAIVVAILCGFDAVAMSNERSADYGNVEYLGMEINHQWSKGLAFERLLQDYVARYVTGDMAYFSLLRPLTELAITRQFVRYPQYLRTATSCNVNWKILKDARPADRSAAVSASTAPLHAGWCGNCPKCAFVFALYAAFLSKKQVTDIFGKNLLADETLIPLYRQLLDLEGFKPFECVGTPEETAAALILAHEQGGWEDSPVMVMAKEEVELPEDVHALIDQELQPSSDHAIPEEFRKAIL